MQKELIESGVGEAVGEVQYTLIKVFDLSLPCLSVTQTAQRLHFTKDNIYKLVNVSKLITIKVGSRHYVPIRSIELYEQGIRQPVYDSLESALKLS